MSAKNDGGPAFPSTQQRMIADHGFGYLKPNEYLDIPEGMSLRDWFAGQASEEDISEHRRNWPHGTSQPTREEAKYLYADAMLAARSQAGGTSK